MKQCWEINSRGSSVRCSDWSGCPGHEWYSLHDNQYCKNQSLWMLANCIEYRGDEYQSIGWPEEEKPESGYTDIDMDVRIQKSQASAAGFTKYADEIMEVIKRLERTGMDGRVLLEEAQKAKLVLRNGYYRQEYSREARNALNYICGRARKHRSYRQWLADRDYDEKKKNDKKYQILRKTVDNRA